MKVRLKKVLVLLLTIAVLISMVPASTIFAETAGDTEDSEAATRHVKLAILSDIHYVSEVPAEGTKERENFDRAERAEDRMMKEIDKILDQALRNAEEKDPDAVLVCGDLTSNGELSNQQGLAAKLSAAKEAMDEVGFYVVNGNHDINNSYAAKFEGDTVQNATRTQVDDFKETYQNLGYSGSNIRFYDATPSDVVQNYGALSYATEIADGITLIALDTAQYGNDTNARFDDAQLVAGEVSDGLLDWAAEEARTAKGQGNLVLAMCHHSLIPHQGIINDGSDMLFSEYLVPNWEQVAGTLADAGVSAVLTGHSHANDISRYTSEAGNTIYDIQTAALCAYPCAWRMLDITITEQDGHADYSFDIKTDFINEVDGLDLEYGGKTYDGLQDYSYDKTGLPADGVEDLVSYLLNEFLYRVKTYDTEYGKGLQGYIREKMEIADDETTVGDALTAMIKETLEGVEYAEFDFEQDSLLMHCTIALKESNETSVSFDVTLASNLSSMEVSDRGVLTVDMTGFPDAFNGMADKFTALAAGEDEDWTTNYKRTDFHKEIMEMIKNSILPSLDDPLDKDDAFSTPRHIAKDALQSFARGDEVTFVPNEYGEMTIEELQSSRKKWNDLLGGEVLANALTSALAPEVTKLKSRDTYPSLYSVIATPLAEDDQSFLSYENEEGVILNLLFTLFKPKNPADMLNILDTFNKTDMLFSMLPVDKITTLAAEIQASMTTDSNVTSDSELTFHTVRFDPQGGETPRECALTTEDGKLDKIDLPTPIRDDAEFLGWFTEPKKGEQVTKDTDFSEISVVYAHWKSIYRIYGSGRYETSFLVADQLKKKLGVEKFNAVILADGRNYPDALAGSYLSSQFEAPILLVNNSHIPAVQDYIKESLNAEDGVIYILGGTGAVPDAVMEGMDGYTFERLAGADRYATNIEILNAGPEDNEIVVCTGSNYADSLSASAVGKPILLVKKTLQDDQKDYLEAMEGDMTFYIIGGTGAVTEDVENALKAHGTVKRIYGSTRYDTSIAVAEEFFPEAGSGVLAYGENFPDGLCGGAYAFNINGTGKEGGPLILTKDSKVRIAATYASEMGITSGAVLGGPALISDESVGTIFDMNPADIIVITDTE